MSALRERLDGTLGATYAIVREIGRGGMATVYLARDAKHDRPVALKVLDPELGAVLGGSRFLSEIRVTANLQHPNLLPLFDSGEAGGLLYYVMPFVDGESLRHRLDRERQLPVDEAVRLAVAVAGALDYAHAHGVVHRDLKPENVLLQAGQPVVADFGIALAVSNAGGSRVTQTGLSLGTPQYMSPEQATGDRLIDARADVYSLAAMTYEMLAGEPPHTGPNAQAIIAKLITTAPQSVRALRPSVPAHVAAAVERGLAKLPADRFATAGAFAAALASPGERTFPMVSPADSRTGSRTGRAIGALAVVAALSTSAAVWAWMRPAEPRPVLRYAVDLDSGEALLDAGRFGRMALSPDGATLVYIGGPKRALLLRRRDELHAKPIPGTDFSGTLCFSPDGRRIAFFHGGALKIAALDGTPPIIVFQGQLGRLGLSWGDDDRIYVDGSGVGPLLRVAAREGATPESFTTVDTASGEREQYFPQVLPGGKRLLYIAASTVPVLEGAVVWLDLATGARHVVVRHATRASYSASGHLVYATVDGTLMAAPFDPAAGTVTGEATVIAEGLAPEPNRLDFTLSRSGTLAYATGPGGVGTDRELVWVRRDGGVERVDSTWTAPFSDPAISPDGRSIAVSTAGTARAATGDVWIRRLASGTNVKLSVERGVHSQPQWTRDGTRLTYVSVVDSVRAIVQKPADGSGAPTTLLAVRGLIAGGLSPDGERLIYAAADPQPHSYVRGLGDGHASRLFPSDIGVELGGALSREGRWLAQVVAGPTGDGLPAVYVSPMPNTSAGRWLVSTGPAMWPVWSPRGDELFYRDVGTQRMMAVPITTSPTFAAGAPRPLFSASAYAPSYDVTPDGSRFLMIRGAGGSARERLTFVENWPRALARRP